MQRGLINGGRGSIGDPLRKDSNLPASLSVAMEVPHSHVAPVALDTDR